MKKKKVKVEQESNTALSSTTVLLKPKYIKDKSVFYKESSYIKDLLGEGN